MLLNALNLNEIERHEEKKPSAADMIRQSISCALAGLLTVVPGLAFLFGLLGYWTPGSGVVVLSLIFCLASRIKPRHRGRDVSAGCKGHQDVRPLLRRRCCGIFLPLEPWDPSTAGHRSRQYPRTCSKYPPRVNPRTLTAVHPSWVISFARRRHAPAPRLRCGISKISKTVCVVRRSTPSKSILPRTRSNGSRHGSMFREAISACACLNLPSHDMRLSPTLPTPALLQGELVCGVAHRGGGERAMTRLGDAIVPISLRAADMPTRRVQIRRPCRE
jgi:hypothetical protein